ncbi:hypothetical protein BDY19DRAFT_454878 [Irpex rosettiformis]|uniref:Uncharacterized protein n=1 Tax=Irpex rosettiformis TaxID=378272 RepID=A0ACB8TT93_9APHY|nr:hypothetical protein BDY19DRAFT_454878 [Irpex rosettiformis]
MSSRKGKFGTPIASNYGPVSSNSSRVPSFKPPSFYAAAAGLKYSPNVDSQTRLAEANTSAHNTVDLTGAPLSYPTGDGEQHDLGVVERSRSNSFSRSFSRNPPKQQQQQRQDQSSAAQSRRKSQMAEIPFLETQLLPSLRDTIDRMTHPPRSAETEEATLKLRDEGTSSSEPRNHNSRTANAHVDRLGQSSIPTSPYVAVGSHLSQNYHSPHRNSPQTSNVPKTPRLGSSSTSNTPRVDSHSPALGSSKLPTGIRNASSLRAEAALSPASVPIPPSPLPGCSPGHTPKTPRYDALPVSLQSGRLPPTTLRSPHIKSPSKLPTPGFTPTASSSQPRSTPRLRQTSAPFQSVGAQVISRSNIPRPNNYTTDSESDLEREARNVMGMGRLVIANGHVSPSSSETTLEQNSRSQSRTAVRNYRVESHYHEDLERRWAPQQTQEQDNYESGSTGRYGHDKRKGRGDKTSVGLGLRFETEKMSRDVSEDDYRTEQRFGQDYDRQYREARDHNQPQRDSERYSQHDRIHRRESGISDERRRREALLGLVNDLQDEYGVHPSDTVRSLEQGSQSPGGVVVTESMEMEQYTVEANHHRRDTDRGANGGSKSRRDRPPRSDSRAHRDLAGNARSESDGHDRRSSSVPPSSRSTTGPPGNSRSQREQRYETVTKSNKARHRTSMSMDQSKSSSRQSSSRSKRTSGYNQDSVNAFAGRPIMKRRDSAAREREAFGIPASLSYGGRDDGATQHAVQPTRPILSRSTSDTEVSTVGDELVSSEANAEGLTLAAEALFDKISGTGTPRPDVREHRSRPRRQSSNGRYEVRAEEHRHSRPIQPSHQHHPLSITESTSAPSIYEPEQESEANYGDKHYASTSRGLGTWRMTLSPQVYERLLSVHGPTEMERQEVIYRFYHAQNQLCQRLQSTIKVFVLPLRRQHSKNWIPGVPTRAGRLFDWLEDIVNLHQAISEALRTVVAPWDAEDIIVLAAKAIRAFVPRMEVYQPYLIRYEEVRQLVADHAATPYDEFGEFVKLQQRYKECDGLTLVDLLDLPVIHLSTCIHTFEQLWRLTTSEHPDHLAAFSLYQSCRMVFHVLWEVKSREEEYEYVKSFSGRIEGLLPSVQLATRERRLLWHGDLTFQRTKSRPNGQPTSAVLSPPSGSSSGRNGAYSTPAIVLSPCPDDRRSGEDPPSLKPVDARVFVFTDVMVIARILTKPRQSGAQWKLVADVGTSRILGVIVPDAESGRVDLELLPLKQIDLQSGTMSDERSIITARLSPSPRAAKNEGDTMLDAFRRCYAHTLRSLSFPSHSGQYLPHGPHLDLEQDTQKGVMAILNAGLPLPKSPSVQLADPGRAGTADPSNDHDREREERGWWALRFQQVLREVQRQDPMLSLQAFGATLP